MSGLGGSRAVMLLAGVVLVSALALVRSTHATRTHYAQLQQLELERWRLQEDYSRLLLEESTLASPHRVLEVSADSLNMAPPQLDVTQVVRR